MFFLLNITSKIFPAGTSLIIRYFSYFISMSLCFSFHKDTPCLCNNQIWLLSFFSSDVFPEVRSSISSPCCQKLAIHPHKRNPSYCHLRFLLCKGIAALTDSKQRSVTRYRRRYFSADFRNLGILKNIIVDYLPYCHVRPQLVEARKNKVTKT